MIHRFRFSPQCCCPIVGEYIGFDLDVWSITSCYTPGQTVVANVAGDITLLRSCKLVFAGLEVECGSAINFAESDWPTVKSWIEAGGRLCLVVEHNAGTPPCLADESTVDAFLVAMGSSIVYEGSYSALSCGGQPLYPQPTPVANISVGLSNVGFAQAAKITGGTSMFSEAGVPTWRPVMRVEALGDGFLFVSGDSNMFGLCYTYDYLSDPWHNCELIRRLYEYADEDII